MQHGEVARQPCRAAGAQGGEGLGDGPAHQREGRAVRGKPDGIGPAAIEGRGDARDERGVVGEPSVHVSDPLDREPAAGQVRLERGQPGVRCFRKSRRLLPDADILSCPAGQHAADTRESEVDVTGKAASDGSPACRVVAQEQDRWLPARSVRPAHAEAS